LPLPRRFRIPVDGSTAVEAPARPPAGAEVAHPPGENYVNRAQGLGPMEFNLSSKELFMANVAGSSNVPVSVAA
jgi:hypothetical protein